MTSEALERYEPVIGLEVHAQLLTRTKIFCGCSTKFGSPPNTNTCPVCLGMPGVLPVTNAEVVAFALRTALATECTVNQRSVWARKNYFYPDLPKGYQITQYEHPLAEHGRIVIDLPQGERTIGITRIQIEEDAGKNIHVEGADRSLVDFNRCGVPLIELVGEPDLRSPDEAVAYLKALRGILMAIGVCDGNLEEGSFRCDVNVSLRLRGAEAFGAKAEIKNVNSFRFVRQALEHEIGRQAALLERGERVVQETRLFDRAKGVTRSMRSKEEAHDYRYFPEPDLPPLVVEPERVERERRKLPELPRARAQRFRKDYDLSAYDAGVLVADLELADYFEQAVRTLPAPKKIANWVINEMLRELQDGSVKTFPVKPAQIAGLVRLIDDGTISGKIAKDVFATMVATGRDPAEVVEQQNLKQLSDTDALERVIADVLAKNPSEVERYRGGKTNLIGFFVGQVMKATQGKGDPQAVNEILRKLLL